MNSDIFVLTTDDNLFNKVKQLLPNSIHINHQSLNSAATKEIHNNGKYDFCFVINGHVDITNFDFNICTALKDKDKVYVWGGLNEICFFNKNLIKNNWHCFNRDNILSGTINLFFVSKKSHLCKKNTLPEIYVIGLPSVESETIVDIFYKNKNTYKNLKITQIYSFNGLTENILIDICNKCESSGFYVIDANTEVLQEFDFTKSPTTTWDEQYLHVWNDPHSVKYITKNHAKLNPKKFTDLALISGQCELKIHDGKYFNLKSKPEIKNISLNQKFNADIFVMTDDIIEFTQCYEKQPKQIKNYVKHLPFPNFTAKTISYIKKNSIYDFCFIINPKTKNWDYNFRCPPNDEQYVHVWQTIYDACYFKKDIVLQNSSYLTDDSIRAGCVKFKFHKLIINSKKRQLLQSITKKQAINTPQPPNVDIFVLTKNKIKFSRIKKILPEVKELPYSSLSTEAIKFIFENSTTNNCFIINDMVDVKNFDFSFSCPKYDEKYVHIWGDVYDICYFSKSLLENNQTYLSDENIKSGNVEFKIQQTKKVKYLDEISDIPPDIFILSKLDKLNKSFINNNLYSYKNRIYIIDCQTELNEKELLEICLKTTTESFYIIDQNTQFLKKYNFDNNPSTEWDSQYVHVWNKCKGVRLLNKKYVMQFPENYTDKAWKLGKCKLKNWEDSYFYLDDSAHLLELKKTITPTVFVIANKYSWFLQFRNKHNIEKCFFIRGSEITPDVIKTIIEKTDGDDIYIVTEFTNIKTGFDFTKTPNYDADDKFIQIWNNKHNLLLITKKLINRLNLQKTGLSLDRKSFKNYDNNIFEKNQNWPIFKEGDKIKTDKPFYHILRNGYATLKNCELNYLPPLWDNDKIHVYQTINPKTKEVFDYHGLELHPNIKNKKKNTIQYIRNPGCVKLPYDIIFLSYKEPFADKNFKELQKKYPRIQRIHGIKGIYEAHVAAAKLAKSSMFFVVDADAKVLDNFDFSYMPTHENEHKVYVWRSKNPINDLVYGYGGIKLFPRNVILNSTDYKIDFTTSISKDFVPISQISNYTMIDYNSFSAWRSAFRECVKLSSVLEKTKQNKKHLDVWCTKGADKKNGQYAIDGARDGVKYAEENINNYSALQRINNYEWLEEKFKKSYDI